MKTTRRILSLLLILTMLLSVLVPSLCVSAEEAEKTLVNFALNKQVTSGWGDTVQYWSEPNEPSFVTDGNNVADSGTGTNNSYMLDTRTAANANPGPQDQMYVTIDLEESCDISEIVYYGYAQDGVTSISGGMVFMLSDDPDFPEDARTIVFNNDTENSWGFGAGSDEEVGNVVGTGYHIALENPVSARYVRYYQNRGKWNGRDMVWLTACEIEVYGAAESEEEPGDAPDLPLENAVPAGNMAYGITPTFGNLEGELPLSDLQQTNCIPDLTSGSLNSDHWVGLREGLSGPAYMQIDLGKATTVNEIKVWQYYKSNNRMFYQAVQVSRDGKTWTTVFNTDAEDKGHLKDLRPNLDGEYDAMYVETADGHSILFSARQVRYIRFWGGGFIWSHNGVQESWAVSPLWVQLEVFNSCVVTFDNGLGGDGSTWSVSVPAGTQVPQPEDPVSEDLGRIFDFWTADGPDAETRTPFDFDQPVTESLTLYAVWNNIGANTVTLRPNNGDAETVLQVTKGKTVTLPGNPVREGYSFAGWKLDGAPFNPATPITEDIVLEACWVPAPAEDAVVVSAGLVDYYLNTKGEITNIISRLDNVDYVPAQDKTPLSTLVSLIADGEHHKPTSMICEGTTLYFTFATINASVAVEMENKGSYTTFTVADVTAPASVHVETLLWGPIKTTIEEVVGEAMGVAYDWEFALGLHVLNDKTVGGWPQEWIELTYQPGTFNQDNTYLSGMSWQSQAAVAAPDKDAVANASGWGGSFLQAYTNNYTKPLQQVVGGYAWVNYDWSDQTNFNFGESFNSMAYEEVPALVNSAYPEDAYIEGSSVALFGCKARNILNTLEEVELQEGLPHPTIDGEWIKTAPAILGSESSGSVNTGSVDAVTKAAAEAGIRYVYGIYGAVGPFVHNGSFRFNGNWGGSDYAAQTQMCDVAAENGVYLGVHSMSDYIGNYSDIDELFIKDYGAHPDLAYAQTTVLTRPASSTDTTLYIADGSCFGTINRGASARYLRIGEEIIRYQDIKKLSANEWEISGCVRGAVGNPAASYEKGASVARLWLTQYGGFLGGYSLAKEISARQGQAFNNTGIRDMSCDGLEDAFKNGYNQLSMNRYASGLWESCNDKDGFYFVNSAMFANQWDMLSFERWNRSVGENMPNYNVSAPSDQDSRVTDPRAYMMRRNLFAQIYGVSTGSEYAMNRDCAVIAALDAGMQVGYLNGVSAEMRAQMKAWTDAIAHNAFTQQQKQDFFNAYQTTDSWTIRTIAEGEAWEVQRVDSNGNAVGDPFTAHAAGKLNVADAEGGNVATTLSMENVTGVNDSYTNKLKAAFAGTVDSLAQPGDIVIVSPQADMGYRCTGVSVTDTNGGTVTLTARTAGTGNYSFVMPEGDVTITPVFEKESGFTFVDVKYTAPAATGSYEIAAVTADHGSVTAAANANAGSKVTVTAAPEDGYRLLQINVACADHSVAVVDDGVVYNETSVCYQDLDGENVASFTMPACDVVVTPVFVPLYEVRCTNVTADCTSAAEGDLVVVDCQTSAGKQMVPGSLLVLDADGNGIPVHVVYADGAFDKYEFSMPASDVTIKAEFADADAHAVATSASTSKGTVTASCSSAKVGETVTFTVSAKTGFHVASVYVLDKSGNQPANIQAADGLFRFNSNRVAGGDVTILTGSFVMPDGDVTVYAYFDGEAVLPTLTHGLDIASLTGSSVLNAESSADKAHDHQMNTAWKTNTVQNVAWDSNMALTLTLSDVSTVAEVKLVPYELSGEYALKVVCKLLDSEGNVLAAVGEGNTYPVGEIASFAFSNVQNVAQVRIELPDLGPGHNVNHLGISEVEVYAPVDKTALQALVEEATALNEDDYTEETWSDLAEALTAAEDVLADEDATQDEVNDAYDALDAAMKALETKPVIPPVDKSELEALVAEAKALNEEDYTEETWSEFAEALAAAEAVLAKEDATQEEVEQALEALREAIDGLTEKTEEPEPEEVDKSALEALYNANKDRKKGSYTDVSWEVFQAALANAEAVLNDENATQEEVDAAEEVLREAVDGLTEKPILPILPVIPGNSTSKPTEEMTYTDVSKTDRYYEDILYVTENGIMNGVGNDKFSPNATLTRAMVVTILYRMEGEPTVRYNALFPDVTDNQWYTKGVEWAANNGIVLGYTTGKFGPNDPVTREQLAAILYRYAQYKNYVLAEGADLSAYADASNISPYAVTAVQWSVTESLLEGENGKLLPRENATRAEVAHAIAGFCRNIGK